MSNPCGPHRYLCGRRGPIWRILQAEQPDLIEVCDKYSLVYLGGLIRRRWMDHRQRPAVAALSCERMDDNVQTFLSRHPAAARFARWYMRHVYMPQFDGHLTVSHYTAGELAPDIRPVTVAPMGLDVGAFTGHERSPDARQQAFGDVGRRREVILLLYVGRLSEEKNLPLLLDVLEDLPSAGGREWHLALAGDGPLRGWLEAEGRRRAPCRLHVLGHVSGVDALARCYANADLLVHPNRREPYGLVPLEAMASGLPVILPRAGGVLEYATESNAWLYTPSAKDLRSVVTRALVDVAARHDRAARARLTAESLDWPAVTDRYFDIYDAIIEASAPTRPVTRPAWHRQALRLLLTG